MPVDRDGHRRPLAPTERLHNLWRNFQAPHGLRRLDVGSKLHNLLLPTLVRDAGVPWRGTAPVERQRCGTRRSGELDIRAAKARRHGEAAVNVEPLARYSA